MIKPYVIAECGVNFNGIIQLAEEMISVAADCGADAVKFQLYSPEAIFGPWGTHPNVQALTHARTCELSENDLNRLAERAASEQIDFSCSVFDYGRFKWLRKLDPPFYKIASRTARTDPDLVWAIAATNQLVFISDGFGWADDYAEQENVLRLHCVSEYPATEANLPGRFGLFEVHQGYSDHTIGIGACLEAIDRGARVLETHFTLDQNLPGPDHIFSSTPQDLLSITSYIQSSH